MSKRKLPSASRGGVAGVALLFCVSAGVAGLAFDFFGEARSTFWLLADPGGRALLGVGAVTAIVLVAHAARWLLARRAEKGGRHAGDHS